MMVKFSPQQIQQLCDIGAETLRHWRKVLPPLAGLNGYSPCFAPSDALALLIVRHLVKHLGIEVGAIAPISTDLFNFCRHTSWISLPEHTLALDIENGSIQSLTHDWRCSSPVILAPVAPFVATLRAKLLDSDPQLDQLQLQFATDVVSKARAAA
jgi:hypothetical protein